jgi:DNA primase
MIPADFIERLKQSIDIEAIIAPYTELKRAGRGLVCLCPFHSEKTPSCHVYADSQSFYCFGCQAGGDAITFIRLIENLDYAEAVRFLAEKSGLTVPENGVSDQTSKMRVRLLEMNREAARFYRDTLNSPRGTPGLDYLYFRGLTPNTIRKYGLGFATDEWDALKKHLKGKGFGEDELIEASLISKGKNNTYDFFRNRVMFPIINRQGHVIAFGGRTIDPEQTQYKYLNTKETLVFRKGFNLFSINFAKNAADKARVYLCEGNMDAVMLNQAGFENSVATCGTALTAEQARLLRGLDCEQVLLVMDADSAGQRAAEKAVNILGAVGLAAKIVELPSDTKDPDDYIRKYGSEAFAALTEKSRSVISFELKKSGEGLELDTPEGRAVYLARAIGVLANIDSTTERAVYMSETARQCGIPAQTVENSVNERRRANNKREIRTEKSNLIRGTVGAQRRDGVNPDEAKFPLQAKAERGIIAYLFHSPDKLVHILTKLSPEDFPTSFHAKVLELLVLRLKKGATLDISELGSEFSTGEVGRIEAIKRESSALPFTQERLDEYIKILTDFKAEKLKKNPADMSAEELIEYSRKLRNK